MRRQYRTVAEALADGYAVYDKTGDLVILWKEVRTIYGLGYLWAEVYI